MHFVIYQNDNKIILLSFYNNNKTITMKNNKMIFKNRQNFCRVDGY